MWLFAGGIAFITVIINLILIYVGKHKYCNILVFISLSSGLIAMLSEYSLINMWVQAEDMSALLDVVPSMNNVLKSVVYIGIILNGIAVFVNHNKLKK